MGLAVNVGKPSNSRGELMSAFSLYVVRSSMVSHECYIVEFTTHNRTSDVRDEVAGFASRQTQRSETFNCKYLSLLND